MTGAVKRMRTNFVKQTNLLSPEARQLGAYLEKHKDIAGIGTKTKCLLTVQQAALSAHPDKFKLFESIAENSYMNVEDAKKDYKNFAKAQLGMFYVNKMEQMSIDKRNEYLTNEAENITKSFDNLDKYLEENMPGFFEKDANISEEEHKDVVNTKFFAKLTRKNLAKEFMDYEKDMQNKVLENPEEELEDDFAI